MKAFLSIILGLVLPVLGELLMMGVLLATLWYAPTGKILFEKLFLTGTSLLLYWVLSGYLASIGIQYLVERTHKVGGIITLVLTSYFFLNILISSFKGELTGYELTIRLILQSAITAGFYYGYFTRDKY